MMMPSRLQEWKKTQVLGSGGYGTVHLAYQIGRSDDPLAVKSAIPRPDAVESLKWEANVLKRLNGAPNVVGCYGDDVSYGVYSLLLEYASFGTLRDLIRYEAPMDEVHVGCYTAMLLNGLAHIHSRGFAHCDLKPSNVLVFPDAPMDELKIADFGLSVSVAEDQENISRNINPPESMFESEFESDESDSVSLAATDILSLGDIVIEMICGEGEPLNLGVQRKLSRHARDFLLTYAGCTAKELLKHPFIETSLQIVYDRYGVDLLDQSASVEAWVSHRNLFSAIPTSSWLGNQ